LVIETDIDGLHKYPLREQGRGLGILYEDDHRLRRFGCLEVVDIEAGESLGPVERGEADEVWALIDGEVEFHCIDKRVGSPSEAHEVLLPVGKDDGEGVFIPFGVRLEIRAITQARLVRVASHKDGSHPKDLQEIE